MKTLKIALVGNPNCGKSTLFNVLTGSHQKTGNWPGVTIERKNGYFRQDDNEVEVIDLPGIYSLADADMAIDARIACEVITSGEIDWVVNIVDATNLERHLYLTLQLLEARVPLLVAVNMLDMLDKQHLTIDLAKLSEKLGSAVVGLSAARKTGIQALKDAVCAPHLLLQPGLQYPNPTDRFYPAPLNNAVHIVSKAIAQHFPQHADFSHFLALSCLENIPVMPSLSDNTSELSVLVGEQRRLVETQLDEEIDIVVADARYTGAHQVAVAVIQDKPVVSTDKTRRKQTVTQRIDRIVLHRVLGIPIFLAAMYLMFFFSINIGGVFQPFFDQASDAIFVQGCAQALSALHVPNVVIALLTLGLGKGINTVVTFIPVLGCLFLWLSFLESSGYMARAAFVVDRVMRFMGLPGKAFVPLIIGFGCNVPAILATRTLEHQRDRLLTLMMTPFMSCGARLAIYAVFTAAFFPKGGQNIVFALYFLGIFVAVMTGFLLRKTVLKGSSSPWILELPPYRCPTPIVLLRVTWQRLRGFLLNAGRYIIPVCLLVGVLNAFTVQGDFISAPEVGNRESMLSAVGKIMTPVFAPMGIDQQNWPATVGLLSGVLAKEVVVGTLNTLYSQEAGLPLADAAGSFHFVSAMKNALFSVPQQVLGLKDSLGNPIAASAGDAAMNASALGVMSRHFDGKIGAVAYLLFVLLYFPCISATAALARESSKRWAFFSVAWTTGLAYVVAVVFYQAAKYTS